MADTDETAWLRAELTEAKSECKVGAHLLAQTGDKLRVAEMDLADATRETARLHARVAELQSELRRVQDLYDEEILPEVDAALDGEACALQALAEAIISRDAAEREADRWRHGVPIEGDYVCPESLRADAVEKQLFDMRAALGVAPEPAPAPVTLDQVVVDTFATIRRALDGKDPSDG